MQEGITIEFGALARPIKSQLESQGVTLPEDDVKRFEEIAYSIVFLHLQDIIPDSVRDNARKKLMKKISVAIHGHARPHTPAPEPKCDDCRFRKDCPLLYFPPCEKMARADEQQAALAATLAAEQTDNILSVLKKRYKNEMAILDYVEMIECEVMALAKQADEQDFHPAQNDTKHHNKGQPVGNWQEPLP